MELALLVLDGLDEGPARDALLKLAMEEAQEFTAEELSASKVVGLILKWVLYSDPNSMDDKVADMFRHLDPSLLSPAVLEKSLECFDGVDAIGEEIDEEVGLLGALVSKRIEWLRNQIEKLNKPFSWQMPGATFPDNAKVEEFLQGPNETMTMTKGVRKFKGFQDASNYAAKWMREPQVDASFKMEACSTDANAVVTITKTRKWFTECQHKLGQYKVELARLLQYTGDED